MPVCVLRYSAVSALYAKINAIHVAKTITVCRVLYKKKSTAQNLLVDNPGANGCQKLFTRSFICHILTISPVLVTHVYVHLIIFFRNLTLYRYQYLICLHATRINVLDLNDFNNCGGCSRFVYRLIANILPDACIRRDNRCHSCNEPQIQPIENLIFVPTHTMKTTVLIYKIYDYNITFMAGVMLFTEDKSLCSLIKTITH